MSSRPVFAIAIGKATRSMAIGLEGVGPEADRGRAQRDGSRRFKSLSAGMDGIDGNSHAAGAIADETTLERARAEALDAHQFLARSDSYNFFVPLEDVIVTAPTGTNVRDIRIFLRSS